MQIRDGVFVICPTGTPHHPAVYSGQLGLDTTTNTHIITDRYFTRMTQSFESVALHCLGVVVQLQFNATEPFNVSLFKGETLNDSGMCDVISCPPDQLGAISVCVRGADLLWLCRWDGSSLQPF